jgi:nitroreductase
MNNILEVIHARRSIRSFNGSPVAETDLREILSAGMTAPSAVNRQPWRFVVITDAGIKREIMNFHPYASFITEAPVAVLVCADKDACYRDYWQVDAAACMENMLLAATALGIANIWTGCDGEGGARRESFKKLFALPDSVEPVGMLVFGYSGETFSPRDNYDETKIHYNKW